MKTVIGLALIFAIILLNISLEAKAEILAVTPERPDPFAESFKKMGTLGGWVQQLYETPEDPKLWTLELKRQQQLSFFFQGLKKKPDVDRNYLGLAIANNYHLKGISLRHLKRYDEALAEHSAALPILNELYEHHRCSQRHNSTLCIQIRGQMQHGFLYMANVYSDLKDPDYNEKFIRSSLALATNFAELKYPFERLMTFHISQDQFDAAANLLHQEIEHRLFVRKLDEVAELAKIAEEFYSTLFNSISWYTWTSDRRQDDPRDFADMYGIGIGKNFKYGMVDPDEDSATFVTVFSVKEYVRGLLSDPKSNEDVLLLAKHIGLRDIDELVKELDLDLYVREQLAQSNFEPVAKYLYVTLIRQKFYSEDGKYLNCPSEGLSSLSIEEIKRQLEDTSVMTVSTRTVHLIELLYKGHEFLIKHCER
jgi:hypothetical protein